MEIHDTYKKFLRKHYSGTSEIYKKYTAGFLERLPPPEDLDDDFVLEFIEPYSPSYQKSLLDWFRNLFRYLGRIDELDGIKGKRIKPTIEVEDLYTKDEVDRILQVCVTPHDRAMVEVLYESGCRVGELVSMTIENTKFLKNGIAVVLVSGKTGSRAVYLYESVPSLKAWLNQHPIGTGILWVYHKKPFKPMKIQGVYDRVRRFLKQAEIVGKKRILHLFRHARLTELAKHLTEAELEKVAGWTTGSKMTAVYVHMSQRDIQHAMLTKVYGVELDDEEDPLIEQLLTAKICPKCKERNPSFTLLKCV